MTHFVFDRSLVQHRLARAAAISVPGADFLLAQVAEDLSTRLVPILRRFAIALDLGTPTQAFATALRASGKVDTVVRALPCAGTAAEAGSLVADAEALPFAAESLDLVVSGLALQFVNDLPGALVQLRRALKPDGLLLAALIGGETLKELREAFAVAESETTGGLSPRVAPFADVRDIGALLQRAGFALPVTDVETVKVRYGDAFALCRDLRAMGATNALLARRRIPLRRSTAFRMAEVYRERFAEADGRIPATFQILWLSGWAPHESQRRPLRPGSAKARLADALKTTERSTEEKAGR
jgi:SAM-dependent methyltransferase